MNEKSEDGAVDLRGALVSIGIPVRNGAGTLERTIRSVLSQEHEPLELVYLG
jgi:glycosyltransferase involved in cell wall biosynthesis